MFSSKIFWKMFSSKSWEAFEGNLAVCPLVRVFCLESSFSIQISPGQMQILKPQRTRRTGTMCPRDQSSCRDVLV